MRSSFRAAFGVTGRPTGRRLGGKKVGEVATGTCRSDRQERGEGREGAFDMLSRAGCAQAHQRGL